MLWCRDQYISMGLHYIVNVISFLNNDCNLVSTKGFRPTCSCMQTVKLYT